MKSRLAQLNEMHRDTGLVSLLEVNFVCRLRCLAFRLSI